MNRGLDGCRGADAVRLLNISYINTKDKTRVAFKIFTSPFPRVEEW